MECDDLSPLSHAEVAGEVERLRCMAQRAHEHGDDLLCMVLGANADSLADALDMLDEVDGDDE
jgi:hypothetical protein